MYLKIASVISILLMLGMIGGSSATDSQYKSDNSSTYNLNDGLGGFDKWFNAIWKFTRKSFWLISDAYTVYSFLPDKQKRQVDAIGNGLWEYLKMKNKGDFSIITSMRFGLYN